MAKLQQIKNKFKSFYSEKAPQDIHTSAAKKYIFEGIQNLMELHTNLLITFLEMQAQLELHMPRQRPPTNSLQLESGPDHNTKDKNEENRRSENHVLDSESPIGSNSLNANSQNFNLRQKNLNLRFNGFCAADLNNAHYQILDKFTAKVQDMTRKILATRQNENHQKWFNRIKQLDALQLNSKNTQGKPPLISNFWAQLEKEDDIADASTQLFTYLDRLVIEEFFLFFIASAYSTQLNTLKANTLSKAWEKHLKTKGLAGKIWKEKSLQIINCLNDTTRSFIEQPLLNSSSDIFEIGKNMGFHAPLLFSTRLYKDIIEIILKIQRAIILTQIQTKKILSPLYKQPLQETNSNQEPSKSPRLDPSQAPIPLEESLGVQQTQIDLVNAQTGVRL
jgi:hypothetical protein